MSSETKEKIAFNVETSRILQILSSEIYDSPKAFLRENVQNAYDAILMRCTAQNTPIAEGKIEIKIQNRTLSVKDNGIGMSEEVLKNNFWKAGSSGKKSELAQKAGVIGSFGIGAMANFGVCSTLQVETRHIDSTVTLISKAKREELNIAQECIELERHTDNREPGTTIIAELDPSLSLNEHSVREYLLPYIRFLPVPVFLNGALVSQESFEEALAAIKSKTGFKPLATRKVIRGAFEGNLETSLGAQGRLLARLSEISFNGTPLLGELFLMQEGGPTHSFRNLFGLSPVPVPGHYNLGGYINLNILHPTAGREALSRESIQHIATLVELIETEASHDIAETEAADHNQKFQHYIYAKNLIHLAKNLTIPVLPSREDIPLAALNNFEPEKPKLFYMGRDQTIMQRFGTAQSNLLNVSQLKYRRQLQQRYINEILKISEVPEHTIVEPIPASVLTIEEAMLLIHIRKVLLDDYMMSDLELEMASISHGVAFSVKLNEDKVQISMDRNMPALKLVLECYTSAREVFGGFVKDFIREHLYPQIRNHVPSSTRQGRDALYQRLKKNKELFRYDENEFGKMESLLAEYLSGNTGLDEVLRSSSGRMSSQLQAVSREQVGSIEQELPGIIDSPSEPNRQPGDEFEPAPPIIRPELITDMKVLMAGSGHEKLNHFQMFLSLSDRAVVMDGDLLRWPHTTRLIWGAHRVIYVFTDATGEISLYYDIELKESLSIETTGGAMFPTTTIITKDKIYVPVPPALESAFHITSGAKEFFVRFDTIP